MFAGCQNIININFISFNIKNVTNMGEMFYGCKSLNNLEGISNWDTKNVTNMRYMFWGCGTKNIPENFSNDK